MSKIIGNTTTTPVPRSNWEQTDKTKADFIRNKPTLGAISEKDTVGKTDLTTDVQSSLEQIDTKANVVTLSTEEYEALETSGTVDANTLYMLTDAEADEAGNVAIDLDGSNEGEINSINADTLGGKYESDLSVSKSADSDRLGGILASEYAMAKDVNNQYNIISENINNRYNTMSESISNLSDEVDTLSKVKPKAGFIYPLASATVPEGFLLCDGAEYLREEYPELFEVIGTTYGSGDGSTTFNVPNLQTRVPIGANENYTLGSTGGEETHTLTVDEMPSHSHLQYVGANSGTWGSRLDWNKDTGCHNYPQGQTDVTGGSQPHNNMQPYTVVNYIIATGKDTGVSVADIITGVQALPLSVEYGGTGATNAEDARNNLEITPENIGAMSKMELLWENASPTSTFAAQTVSVDLTNYFGICITYFGHIGSGAQTTSGILFKDSGTNFIQYCGRTSTISDFDVSWRNLTISNNGVEFQDCEVNELEGSQIGSTTNKECVPTKIYGIKGVTA